MSDLYQFTERLFISTEGDYNSGGWLIDTRLWTDADWKEFESQPRPARFEWAMRRTALIEKDFEILTERLRDAKDEDIELRHFVIDEDGVTEVDEDNNPL